MSLTQFRNADPVLQMLQTSWAQDLNPVIANALNQGSILKNIPLLRASSPNVINHQLGRTLQGWFIVGQNGIASIYDTQTKNQTPHLTLQLITSVDVTVNIAVF